MPSAASPDARNTVEELDAAPPDDSLSVSSIVAMVEAIVMGTELIEPSNAAIEEIRSPACASKSFSGKIQAQVTPDLSQPALKSTRRGSIASEFTRRSSLVLSVASKTAFFEVFGLLGIPMVFTLLLAAGSTFFLAYLQVYATKTVNAVMKTQNFNSGEFWLLPYPDLAIVVSATALLVLFGCGFFGLVLLMLFGRRLFWASHMPEEAKSPPQWLQRFTRVRKLLRAIRTADLGEPSSSESRTLSRQRVMSKARQSMVGIYRETTSHDGKYRYFYSAALDLPKLIFQTSTLITYLRHGFPTPLIYFYAHLLLVSWLATAYRYQRFETDHKLVIARLFYLFDLFFAVFAPLVVLGYAMYAFEFDRVELVIKTATLRVGAFESNARLYGDPKQIAIFRLAFHYLQFSSGSSLFVKSALNLLSLYKWRKIIQLLNHTEVQRRIEAREIKKQQQQVGSEPAGLYPRIESSTKPFSGSQARPPPPPIISPARSPRVKPEPNSTKRNIPTIALAASFLVAGGVVFVYAIVSVASSENLCAKYPHCAVASYQWNVGAKDCTCLVFVDRNLAPASFDEWLNPPDTTANLARLAVAGELRIIQIINRALPELPVELRNCHELEQLILIYSRILTIPDWTNEFHKLEYLHIGSDYTSAQLSSLPPDLFSAMPHLTFLHLGTMINVSMIPNLSHLHELRSLTIAAMNSVHELPSFEGLGRLMKLSIIDAFRVTKLPSFAPLKKLTSFGITARNPVCCNGYLTGVCNLSDFQCKPRADEELVSCTDARINNADLKMLTSIGATLCTKNVTMDLKSSDPKVYTSDTLCNGTMYRKCSLGGATGICFNLRMQVISCVPDPSYITMRKLLIQSRVGAPCDPSVEAWLGCVK